MDEITLIRAYIYKCCAGDDKLAGNLFVRCVTTNYAPDEVLELAKKGDAVDKDSLRVRIWYADYD